MVSDGIASTKAELLSSLGLKSANFAVFSRKTGKRRAETSSLMTASTAS